MAKLYHKNTAESPAEDPDALLLAIETFLHSSREAAVLEYGEEILPLNSAQYALEIRSGRLWIDVWTDTRTISRRILSIERQATGVLDCTVHRFGGQVGKLSFLDLDRPQTAHRSLAGARHSFAEQFRRMLFRQFPAWEIEALTSSMDLRRSFSPVFPRARLTRGRQQLAAVACPTLRDEPAMLAFALIWHAYLRVQHRDAGPIPLCVFLPEQAGNLTAHRLRWLTGEPLDCRLFRFNAHGSAGEVDPEDLGNLETRVTPASARQAVVAAVGSERLFECAVREHIARIDPTLLETPVHRQVLTFAAGDRDLIDLLAVSSAGRLAVLELKITEDLQLPIQALDYWMRIRWHAERGELQQRFPKVPLSPALPKLFFVAPAMCFHSSNTTILRYFSPAIEIERVGINADWERRFRVVLRLSGAEMPISHGSSE
ncbi:MAG: YkgJ family cysteine cluster protein [Acidobacteriaceae bacterium]|nr:YkgJ family cysteine cluster protein [Acidobacteriaceae bacterium]